MPINGYVKTLRVTLSLVLLCVISACGSKSPTAPATQAAPATAAATLTKPVADSPGDGAQLDNVRPTLAIVNGTSNQGGTRTYEFQISDNSAFTASANAVSSPDVSEDPSGRTKFALGQDLQPTTTYYWHARVVQGTSKSDWSDTRSFKTKLAGFNRPGALYDPLVDGETVGSIGGSGNITWVPGQGIRMNDQLAYVVYELPQVYSSGEISVEATGLGPGGSPGKGRIFSILDRMGVLASSARYSINVQYRGVGGAPDNCIAWKAVLGDNAHSVEPNTTERYQSVVVLDPSRVYLWQGFWTPTSVRVVVKEGGMAGPVVYDHSEDADSGTSNWNPAAMYAFLGTNNASYTGFDGTREGMTLRNLWVGSTPRPASLGSAIAQVR
jgi:hypothetical protein